MLVSPVTRHFLPAWPPMPSDEREEVATAVERHVAARIGAAPLVLRMAVVGLAGAFNLAAFVHGRGRRFSRQSPAQRDAFVVRWSALAAPTRAYERLVRSLTLASAYEHPLSKMALGCETDTVRRHARRAIRALLVAGPANAGASPGQEAQP